MGDAFEYDVFLSHSSKDKTVVRELAERLRADGLRVWLDEWVIQPGDMIGLKVEEGLEKSRVLILFMSANAFASDWVTLERQTALFRDPTNAQRRFIPLRLDDTELKDTLKQFAYVDWQQQSEEQYEHILTVCRPVKKATRTKREKNIPSQPLRRPKLNDVLFGHMETVLCVSVTSDGRLAVSGSGDKTIRVWDLVTGQCTATLKGHSDWVRGVSVTSDGRLAVSGSDDKTVRVWDLVTGQCTATLKGHSDWVRGVSVTSDGRLAVSGSVDGTVRVWDLVTRQCIYVLKGHKGIVWDVSVTPDGRLAVSCSGDKTVRVWDLVTGKCTATLEGHGGTVWNISVTPDSRLAVSGSDDKTVRVWDIATGQCTAILEGHDRDVNSVSVTPDGRLAVSGSGDKTVRVWDIATGQCIANFRGHEGSVWNVSVTSDGRLAVSGSDDSTVRVWGLPLLKEVSDPINTATRYTNAKVLLVGESGAGKSGLALRLTEDRFEPTDSTDGVWATQIQLPHSTSTDDIEREIWLWDFAGQSDYRLIHQLFMDETALAVLVFNPQSENPFEGLGQWDSDLQRAARRSFNKLLVAGRCDRGGLTVSRESIEQFQTERGFTGYFATSASTGEGCRELLEAIVANINWDAISWTSSPRIFKRIKEEIVRLKDESAKDSGKALLRMGELKQQLEMRLPNETFTPEELQAVVGLLAGPGVVWQLEFGDFVMLQPERINSYAAAVVRSVRAHTEEIGCIREEDVLAGRLDYQNMKRLPFDEEPVALRAMHQTFVEHGLCLRENTDADTLLVFPSYFRRERPELSDHPAALVTYHFSGPLDEIYATLVVRLHHTSAFDKDKLWRYAADFKTLSSKRVGLKMNKLQEGTAELTIYCEPDVADEVKAMFIRYVHHHLRTKAPDVKRTRHYVCVHCGTPLESRKAVETRLLQGKKDILCAVCENRIQLWDLIEAKFASEDLQKQVREMDEKAGIKIDNESRELILVGHAFTIAAEAGQIFRPTSNSDWGVDGEIEFKDDEGNASGARVYLQLKSGDSHTYKRKGDGQEIFTVDARHAKYWQQHAYSVMLVIRSSDGQIRWMNATEYLKKHGRDTRQIVFNGEPFTALNVFRLRDKMLPPKADKA